ncbi:unnamed protein product, partial [Protopolystoma xenopodis]
ILESKIHFCRNCVLQTSGSSLTSCGSLTYYSNQVVNGDYLRINQPLVSSLPDGSEALNLVPYYSRLQDLRKQRALIVSKLISSRSLLVSAKVIVDPPPITSGAQPDPGPSSSRWHKATRSTKRVSSRITRQSALTRGLAYLDLHYCGSHQAIEELRTRLHFLKSTKQNVFSNRPSTFNKLMFRGHLVPQNFRNHNGKPRGRRFVTLGPNKNTSISPRWLLVVTGRGTNSPSGGAKLLPAVRGFLSANNYEFVEGPGYFYVRLSTFGVIID